MMEKNLICIPFAYNPGMSSGVNLGGVNKEKVYLKNICVAAISAKKRNPNCDVAVATNFDDAEIPTDILKLFHDWDVQIIHIPFDSFRFDAAYPWCLAFYKLCVLKHLCEMTYDKVCYMDTDVFIQDSFDGIWKECNQNILLYDINHGLNTPNYVALCNEVEKFEGSRNLITHYGGEFFASSIEKSKVFSSECEEIFQRMSEKNFVTSKGDEFILSLAADKLKANIKNASPYVCRFWTGASFRLVSTCYEYNRVVVLHMPAEKEHGMLKMYSRYISHSIVPDDQIAWRTFRLSKRSIVDRMLTWANKSGIRKFVSSRRK